MQEKTKHYWSIFFDFVIWSAGGVVVAVMLVFGKGAPVWAGALVGILFAATAIAMVTSPKVRRYMRKQYLGASRFPEAHSVGELTILEDEFEAIRTACLEELQSQRPGAALREWQGRDWFAVRDQRQKQYVFVLFPGMFTDEQWTDDLAKKMGKPVEFAMQCSVVAMWTGSTWKPTSLFVPGNETEAEKAMQEIMDGFYASGGMEKILSK